MRRLVVALVSVAAATAAVGAAPAIGDPIPSALGFAMCSEVQGIFYPQPPAPVPVSCGQPAYPAGLDSNCEPFPANSDLGSFSKSDKPFGVIVHVFTPNMPNPNGGCILGAGAGFAENDLVVTVTDLDSGKSFTTVGSSGEYSVAIFPLHHGLKRGTYGVTVDFLGGVTCSGTACSSWEPTSTSGTVTVG